MQKFNDHSKGKKYQPRYASRKDDHETIKMYDTSNNQSKLLEKYELSYESRFSKDDPPPKAVPAFRTNALKPASSNKEGSELERGLKDTVLSKYETKQPAAIIERQSGLASKQNRKRQYHETQPAPKQRQKQNSSNRLASILERYQKSSLEKHQKPQKPQKHLQTTTKIPSPSFESRTSEKQSLKSQVTKIYQGDVDEVVGRRPRQITLPRQVMHARQPIQLQTNAAPSSRTTSGQRGSLPRQRTIQPKSSHRTSDRQIKKQEILKKIKQLNDRLRVRDKDEQVLFDEGGDESDLRRQLAERDRQVQQLTLRVQQQQGVIRQLSARLRDQQSQNQSLNEAVEEYRYLFEQLSQQ